MFEFTTIGNGSSLAKLLTLDSTITILADPGWNGIDSLDFYSQHVNGIDMILLSQTTTNYIGAYAYLLYQYPKLRSIPTYSTLPITKLGRVSTCELYRSIGLLGPVEGNTIEYDDILKYFNNIKCLNYSQNIHLSHVNNKLINLSLTPYNSGYSIGGSIWLIENNINEKIIYAPMWNHSKDEFLNNCRIFNNTDLIRPTTLITNSEYISTKYSHSNRIESFLKLIQQNIDNGTNVLLPTTLTGRFFELIIPILLNKKIKCNIYMLNFTSLENLKILSNFLEWMNQSIIKLWENENQSEILFEHNRIQLIKFDELENLVSTSDFQQKPKIFFVEEMNLLEGSIFNQFLIDMNSRLNYTMILTEKPTLNSKLNQFYKIWKQNVDATEYDPKEGTLIVLEIPDVRMTSIKDELLRGKELAAYLKKVNEKKEVRAKLEKEELERKKIEEMLDNEVKVETDSDDDDDGEEENEENAEKALKNINNEINGNLQSKDAQNSAGVEITANIIKIAEMKFQMDDSKRLKIDEILSLPRDFDVRNMKHKNRVFPYVNNRFNADDYGIVIKHEDFQIYDDDRFPIIGEENEEVLNEDNNQSEEKTESESESDEDRRGKRGRRGGNGSRRKRRNRGENHKNSLRKGKDENALYQTPVYSLGSTVDPVSRDKKTTHITLRCGISFIDLGGNHDLRSLKFTIKQIQPRKVIILPSLSGDSSDLMNELRRETKESILAGNGNSTNVDVEYIKSNINKKIDLGEVITSYELLLDEKLASNLSWQNLSDGYSVSSVNGVIEKLKDWEFKLKDSSSVSIASTSTKIGDVKLAQLRQALKLKKHRVDLMGDGRLVVDDELIIGKANEGNLSIEGGLGNLFYEVKNLIEGMLATV
ncbi:hypothetical protein C6P42_002403 [Pichia californica]|nr:hypothetical protein C6P42_002403 [[Candida] californica]